MDDRKLAYEAGVRDQELESNRVYDMEVKVGEALIKISSKAKKRAHKGKVISELSNETRKTLTSSQQNFFYAMARMFNVDTHIVDNENMNGMYVDGNIYLSVDADRNLAYVFAYEITHHMQVYAPKEYGRFKELVRSNWAEHGGLSEAIRAKVEHYAEHGKALSQEGALDEILADSTYEMLQDEAFVENVCKTDRTLAQAIVDAIKNIIAKLRKILAEGDSFTPKQNEALLSNLGILKDAEKLWVDGLMKASENRAAVGKEGSEVR